ncbi:GNAT family N-acetyltransferase [Candidatus Bipolaricaulota bacterium]|nr:GNAT family N-acetyltransferase [Candidatus Bipolaricaulota bacterium]
MDIEVRIARAEAADRDMLVDLVARIETEDHPDGREHIESAPAAARRSLEQYDILSSDAVWCLIATVGDDAAALATLTRIPKLDDRLGFLYLDELHVLQPWRQRDVGRALLRRAIELARELGLAGVRLLTRRENELARALYESIGSRGDDTVFYQLTLDRENADS